MSDEQVQAEEQKQADEQAPAPEEAPSIDVEQELKDALDRIEELAEQVADLTGENADLRKRLGATVEAVRPLNKRLTTRSSFIPPGSKEYKKAQQGTGHKRANFIPAVKPEFTAACELCDKVYTAETQKAADAKLKGHISKQHPNA